MDCKEAKKELYVKGSVENGRFFVVEDKKAIKVFCDLITGKKGDKGFEEGSPAKDCKEMLDIPDGDKSGLFWINPDGGDEAIQVYCEQESNGGGWILLQHNHKHAGGGYPCGLAGAETYNQKWDGWFNKGIKDVSKYADAGSDGIIDSGDCYWMPFKHWARIVGHAADEGVIDDLMMVPENGWDSAIRMFDFWVTDPSNNKLAFGLHMSNRKEIQ